METYCTNKSSNEEQHFFPYGGTEDFVDIIEARDKKNGYAFLKRSFDFGVALLACFILLAPMAVIGVAIYLDSKGPIIFRQERLGKNGIPFVLYKFRSMYLDAEANGPQWAKENDARCTRVGLFLRKSHLDELPQLFNILKGEMSFVGPRPERSYYYDQFEKDIPDFRNRLAVTPGLTGLAQVNGGYDLGPKEKLVYDMAYIEKRSIGMDIYCLLKTIPLVFTHKGAR